jgi:tRNA-specific 2-thiouridylase
LVEKGYDVIGITMKLPNVAEVPAPGCCGVKGINDARSVASKLDMPFYVKNCDKKFENLVIEPFCMEYACGRTPNPCVVCNDKMKFGVLLDTAKSMNADYVATGHYARIVYDKKNKRYFLKKGRDKDKDQSYFLFPLSQKQLSSTLFPLGEYTKNEVRSLAKKYGLGVHDKPGSQEICFIPDNNYRRFLKDRAGKKEFKPGKIVYKDGRPAGTHNGIAFYTIGQRKGIGAHSRPYYVTAIDKERNTVVIGEEKDLYKDTLVAGQVNWIAADGVKGKLRVKACIRYRHPGCGAYVYPLGPGRVKVVFDKPQRAVTPGQAVVFYKGDTVIGGGWIR